MTTIAVIGCPRTKRGQSEVKKNKRLREIIEQLSPRGQRQNEIEFVFVPADSALELGLILSTWDQDVPVLIYPNPFG